MDNPLESKRARPTDNTTNTESGGPIKKDGQQELYKVFGLGRVPQATFPESVQPRTMQRQSRILQGEKSSTLTWSLSKRRAIVTIVNSHVN